VFKKPRKVCINKHNNESAVAVSRQEEYAVLLKELDLEIQNWLKEFEATQE
jgi:hypothetical protein